MLRGKLFLLIVSILSFTLVVTGYIYYKNINDIFNIQIQKDINRDKNYIKNNIEKRNKNLLALVEEISLHSDLKSSLNLISLYEDPTDYVKETFDFEKNNLIELSNKWIKESEHYSMALYNKELQLIMLNRKLDKNIALGYFTYNKNGKKEFLDYKTKKTTKTPFIKNINLNNIEKFQINFYIGRFLISYLKPITLDGNTIGYLEISTCIDEELLKSINKSLSLTAILSDQDGNYLFPSSKIKDKFEKFKLSDDIDFVESNILNLNNKLNSISLIDRTIITEKLNDVMVYVLEIWIVLLIVIFTVSVFFINITILNPINKLKESIENIKNGKIPKIIDTKNKDEISNIVQEFNSLSLDLSKNIAFLESYELAMDESSIVSKSDLKGNITYVNQNFCKITGYTKDEVLGKPHNIVRDPDNKKELFRELWETIKAKKVWKGIIKNRGKLSSYWVDISILPILDENKNIVEYIAIRHDITKMIEQQEKLDNIANTDTLTGLSNRYKLINDIKISTSPALAILNIDNFSQVNDFYGHEVGDVVIKSIGDKLLKLIDDKDFNIYHLKGDEYVVFNQDIKKDIFLEKIYNLKTKLNKITVDITGEILSSNFTIGISFESKENILITADIALKVAKRTNENLILYSDEISLNEEYENNIKWTKKIKDAIENDKFTPVFQPIVKNQDESWEKYECLVRLIDEDKLISPYFFLDISKKSKHYTQITKIMIEKSFNTFKDIENKEFSINLTIEDILNNEIKTFIFTTLEICQIGSRVVFEIVESESIENFEDVLQFITTIKSYGCKIAIDDFGTGYSNFEYLVKLNADFVKIDGSLIKDIDKDKTSQIVVKNIINFAHDLGMKTIAEFVENESIQNKVKELGVDYSQGYYFSEPKLSIL
ncbi:MAG: EAL domain-containing protein [Campylobacterota bacterium]|nr:EAL domain-containing protein [Campylobacterota bacterium]